MPGGEKESEHDLKTSFLWLFVSQTALGSRVALLGKIFCKQRELISVGMTSQGRNKDANRLQ